MRLIDADALTDIFSGQPPEYYTTAYLTGLIDRMPTVAMGTEHVTINWTPDLDKLARDVAYRGLNEFKYLGKSIQEWVEIILEQPHWVSVKDRLPEKGAYVLLLLDNKYYCIAHYIGDGMWITPGYGGCDARWWMPLPEPPEGVSGDAAD